MTAPADPSTPQPTWSPEARTAASLALFLHLFAIVVAVTTYTQPSGLQRRLHELFDPYLRNLHLTAYPVSYPFARYHLTHSLPTDVDFACEVTYQDAQGEPQTASIPPAGLQPLVRYRRYQALANATGTLADAEADSEFGSILPQVIAGSILKRHGAAQGEIVCRAHDQPFLEDMAGLESGRTDPTQIFRNVYEAQVLVSDLGVDVLRKSTTLEVAPSEASSRRPAARQRPAAPQNRGAQP